MITFISGGARSGKSTLAEELALKQYSEVFKVNPSAQLAYIATAKKSDFENDSRIKLHQEQRGSQWVTIEEPYFLQNTINHINNHSVILVDCLTVWTGNVMFNKHLGKCEMKKLLEEFLLLATLKNCSIYLVSNDVNEGIPIKDVFVQRYIYNLEFIHKFLIGKSDSIIQAVAGIPLWWKMDGEWV